MQSIICMSNTQPMHTTCMHLGIRSYYGTRVRVLKENATHLARSIRLQSKYSKASRLHKHGTNHNSLQVHENNPKSLQKQHGYKSQKLHKQGYKTQNNRVSTYNHQSIVTMTKNIYKL